MLHKHCSALLLFEGWLTGICHAGVILAVVADCAKDLLTGFAMLVLTRL